MRTDALRTHAKLDMREYFALDPLQVGQRCQQDKRDETCFDQTKNVEIHVMEYSPQTRTAPPDAPSRD